jgi:hypothetical protein
MSMSSSRKFEVDAEHIKSLKNGFSKTIRLLPFYDWKINIRQLLKVLSENKANKINAAPYAALGQGTGTAPCQLKQIHNSFVLNV